MQAGPPRLVDGPTVSGTARRAERADLDAGEWIGIENDYAYQWQRDSGSGYANIAGATEHDLPARVGRRRREVRLKVTATNDDGTAAAFSAATSTVAAAAPTNLAVPTVTGSPRKFATLTAFRGEWTPEATYQYQWQRDGNDIPDATARPTRSRPATSASSMRVKVTAINVDGAASAVSAPTARVAAPPVNTRRAGRADRHAAPGVHAHRRRRHAGTPGHDPRLHVGALRADRHRDQRRCDAVGAGTTYLLSSGRHRPAHRPARAGDHRAVARRRSTAR